MFDDGDVYWFGTCLQVLVMTALFINIWLMRNCSGISLRSQILYALVFTARQLDLESDRYVPPENIVVKVIYIIVTYSTVLSISKCFSKTYEKQHDIARIDISIIACLVLSLIFNESFDYLEILMAFSMYLEVVAMIPQFQLIFKTERLHKNVMLYIIGMAIYSFLQVGFACTRNPWYYQSKFQIVSATTQFLLYCDFFRRIQPFLGPEDRNNQYCCKICSFLCSEKSRDVEANIDDEVPDTGHVARNMSNVVPTPSSTHAEVY